MLGSNQTENVELVMTEGIPKDIHLLSTTKDESKELPERGVFTHGTHSYYGMNVAP